MTEVKNDEIRRAVRERYVRVAKNDGAGCRCSQTNSGAPAVGADSLSWDLGPMSVPPLILERPDRGAEAAGKLRRGRHSFLVPRGTSQLATWVRPRATE